MTVVKHNVEQTGMSVDDEWTDLKSVRLAQYHFGHDRFVIECSMIIDIK